MNYTLDLKNSSLGRGLAETMVYFGWIQYAFFYTNDGVRNKCYYIKQGIDVSSLTQFYF